MLDALLSARKVLYVSWAGHSPRDNTEQPPSVLVAQLRDYLAATWSLEAVHERTVQHPLQPFSRHYFDRSPGLFTYAKEWRAAHQVSAIATTVGAAAAFANEYRPTTLSVADLSRFLQNPVREFFKQRLAVEFPRLEAEVADEEMFVPSGLEQWALADEVLRTVRALGSDNIEHSVEHAVARLQRAGRLALGGPGLLQAAHLRSELGAMLRYWQVQCAQQSLLQPALSLRWSPPLAVDRLANAAVAGLVLADELSDLRSAGHGAPLEFFELQASNLANSKGVLRADKLLTPWLRGLLAAACGQSLCSVLIGRDGWVAVPPFKAASAQHSLGSLLALWQAGVQGPMPLPVALQTGIAVVQGGAKAAKLYEGDERRRGERDEPCLARTFPDYAALAAAPRFVERSQQLYGDYVQWLGAAPALQAYAGCLPEAAEGHDDE
jgi:exodeoxyribonuclease V gamma subunit